MPHMRPLSRKLDANKCLCSSFAGVNPDGRKSH
jgi:hypothetical protein